MTRREPKEIVGWREFQIQRLNILLHMQAGSPMQCEESYLFAWSKRVYPILSDSILHEGFEDCFYPNKEMMDRLCEKLHEAFVEGIDPPTFHRLEDEFTERRVGSDWHRSDLIDALRYLALCKHHFSKDFWPKVIRNHEAPSEAKSFFDPFDAHWDANLN